MQTFTGSCHCGRTKFEVDADVDHVRICDCSICRKRGALIHRVPDDALRLISPIENLTTYRWGSNTAVDYFCPVCGVLTFRRPRWPTENELESGTKPFDGWAVNTSCLHQLNTRDIPRKKIYGSKI